MLNDELLTEFAENFYGYGNYQAPYWFLGMEEGGGNSVDEINLRFSAWADRGKNELEDVAEYHCAIGIPELFSGKPKLQNTWNKQIHVLFGLKNQAIETEFVRNYQRDSWGRNDSENCILELFPLPSPSTGDWIYGKKSFLLTLRNRDIYRETYLPNRIEHIQKRVEEYNPKVVFIFGVTYVPYWEKLVGVSFFEDSGLLQTTVGKTKFVVLQHPVAHGVTNEYFYNAGQVVAKSLV